MANPDFTYKPDASIIQAFQNANAQRMQAEQLQEQKKQRQFQQVKETTEAVSSMVSSMVKAAEERKTKNTITEAISLLSKPKPEATVIPEGPTLDNASLSPVINPEIELRKQAALRIGATLNPKQLGEAAVNSAFPEGMDKNYAPQQGAIELMDGKIIPAVFKGGQYYYPNTNDVIPPEKIASKGYGMVPVTTGSGAVVMTSKGTGKGLNTVSTTNAPVPEEKKGTVAELTGLETKDREKAFAMIESAKSDPLISKNRSAIQTMQGLRQAIQSDDRVAMDRMGGLMQKVVAQDSGNLAAWEQRDPNSRAALDRLQNWVSFAAQGKPTKETKEMILKTIDNMENVAHKVIDDSFDLGATSVVETFPQLNKKAVLRKMGAEALKKKASPEQEANDFFRGL